jgi:tetratricopeptide (TPR) repeat protein
VQTRDRVPIVASLILAVAITGVLFARRSTQAPRPPSDASDAVARAHEAAGVRTGDVGPVAPGFDARLAESRARLADSPDDPDRLLDLARLLHDGHRPDEAVALYRRALDMDPGRAEVQYDLAAVLAELRRWPEATEVLEARLAQAPDDVVALYDLGAIRANAGDPEGARGWFERARSAATDTTLRRRAEQALERLGGEAR